MSPEKPNDGLVAGAIGMVKRVSDQKYLFALAMFFVACAAVGTAAATIGLAGAVGVLALLIVFAAVLAWVVRTLPEPASAGGVAPRKWSIRDTTTLQELLSPRQYLFVYQALVTARRDAAESLRVDAESVRVAIHARKGRRTCLLADFHVGDFAPGEVTVTMKIGTGAAGLALKEVRPVYHLRSASPGDLKLDKAERNKLHPQLRWVAAAPVVLAKGGSHINVWVLAIDGLFEDRPEAELRVLAKTLTTWTSAIAGTLADVTETVDLEQ